MSRALDYHAVGGLAALLAVLAVFLDGFQLYQAGLFLIYAIAGVGVALCWGKVGFLPLGQALFIGLAGYLAGFALKAHADSPWLLALLLPACAIPSAVLAGLIAYLVFRRRHTSGPYFSLITLALSIAGFQVANSWQSVTGGFNGLGQIPQLPGIDRYSDMYYLIASFAVLAALFLTWLCRTPLGVLWQALSDNELRLRYCGFDTAFLKALAFAIAGFFAGLAGVLYAPHQGLVSPQLVGFFLSAELVVWVAVGGRNSIVGAALGCLAIGFLSSELRANIRYWEIIVAAVFVVTVLRYPGGLAQLVRNAIGIKSQGQRGKTSHAPIDVGSGRKKENGGTTAFDKVKASSGPTKILNGASFAIPPGITCLIGPNGAGKTSCFNSFFGMLPRSSGNITLDGKTLGRIGPPDRIVRAGVGRKLQVPSVFESLTIGNNLLLPLWMHFPFYRLLDPRLFGCKSQAIDMVHGNLPSLDDASKVAGELAQGEKQMLEFGVAVAAMPRLTFLDEPCAGLTKAETKAVAKCIKELNDRHGMDFLVIEHDMDLVLEMSDQVVVLHQGAVIAEGSYTEVREVPEVREVYAGRKV